MTYRYKGKYLSEGAYKRYGNLRNVKKYLSKKPAAKYPPKKPPARKKPPATKPVSHVREIERATREALRRDSEARQREIERKAGLKRQTQEKASRKRERVSRQGLIVRDLEETDPHGVKGSKPVRWNTRGSYNLRVTRIRKTYKPGYKKVHRKIEHDTRYTKADVVQLPFKIGPETNANEEMEAFMEKILSKYTLPGDEEFYGTIETPKKRIARTIAKRQEIPVELRCVRRRSKSR